MTENENIKIVLLHIESNTERVKQQFTPPFGILMAATVLRNHSINVVIKHLIWENNIENKLNEICEDALAVGFSTMTSSNLIPTITATKYVKSLGYYTFWGGIHATLLPEISLKEKSLDAVLRGEAETNLFQFVMWRLDKIKFNEVKGLCFKNSQSEIYIDNIPLPINKNKIVSHSFDLLDINNYFNKEKNKPKNEQKNYIDKKMIPLMTSKGCNMKCSFCYNSVVNQCLWREYKIENVYKEMDYLIENYGIEGWLFYDDNFFVNTERAWNILEKYNMPSFVEIHLSKINYEFIKKAKHNKIERLLIGIESGSDKILKMIKKGINIKMIKERIKLCYEHNLNIELSFMILFPHETAKDLEMTFDLIEELSKYKNVTIADPKIYNPYPGTELYSELIKLGWKQPKSNEEWAKFERKISPLETGFGLTDKHLKILNSKGLI